MAPLFVLSLLIVHPFRENGSACTRMTDSFSMMARAVVVMVALMTCGTLQAAKLQLMSVKEASPGAVTATVGISGGGTPTAPDFQLRFDEKNTIPAREVRAVPAENLETSVILCIDQSGSMGASIKQIQEALGIALSKPPLQTSIAIWAFETEVTNLQNFSMDTAELSKALRKIGLRSVRDGKTKLYEAIGLGLSELRNHKAKGPKHLILVTDGTDDGSSITDQVVINEANAKGIVIDAIGFGKVSGEGSALLAHLAKNTGGHFVLPKGTQELSRELVKLLNPVSPRTFDVSFTYETSGGSVRTDTAKLEYTGAEQERIGLAIGEPLSFPGAASSPASTPDGKSGVDLRIFGALAAVFAILIVYLLIRRKPDEPKSPEPVVVLERETVKVPEPAAPKRAGTMVSFTFPPPGKGRPAAHLDCVGGSAKGRQFSIEQTVYRIGSGNENELQVSDDYVSQKHAAIRYDSGSLYLSDGGSRNGTFLNGARLHHTAMVLTPGDEIRVGRTSFKVRTAGQPGQGNNGNIDPREPYVP